MTMPAPQPEWHQLTPDQQAWHWQHYHQTQANTLQQQLLQVQRQQAEMQRRNRGHIDTLVGLFVWVPISLMVVGFGIWLLLRVVT